MFEEFLSKSASLSSRPVHKEIKKIRSLEKVYKDKLKFFLDLLREYHVMKSQKFYEKKIIERIAKRFRNLARSKILDEGSKLHEVMFTFEKLLEKIPQRARAKELLEILKSDRFEKLKRILLLQRNLVEKEDFYLSDDTLADLKHALYEEQRLLGFEKHLLPEIEDALKHLHDIYDPFKEFDANTVAASVRHFLVSSGFRDALVKAVGSTARGMGPKTADYDIGSFIPESQISWVKGDKFRIGLNKFSAGHPLPGVKKIMWEQAMFNKGLFAFQVNGRMEFYDGEKADIHLTITDDMERYEKLCRFGVHAAKMLEEMSSKRRKGVANDVKALKAYFRQVGLYRTGSEAIVGRSIEELLHDKKLSSLAKRVVSNCFPWSSKSKEYLMNLLQSKFSSSTMKRFHKNESAWDSLDFRLHRFALAFLRISYKIVPGMQDIFSKEELKIDIRDVQKLFPGSTIFYFNILHQKGLPQFIKTLASLREVNSVIIDQNYSVMFVVVRGAKKTVHFRTLTLKNLPSPNPEGIAAFRSDLSNKIHLTMIEFLNKFISE